jgi:hypothetical protein
VVVVAYLPPWLVYLISGGQIIKQTIRITFGGVWEVWPACERRYSRTPRWFCDIVVVMQ